MLIVHKAFKSSLAAIFWVLDYFVLHQVWQLHIIPFHEISCSNQEFLHYELHYFICYKLNRISIAITIDVNTLGCGCTSFKPMYLCIWWATFRPFLYLNDWVVPLYFLTCVDHFSISSDWDGHVNLHPYLTIPLFLTRYTSWPL